MVTKTTAHHYLLRALRAAPLATALLALAAAWRAAAPLAENRRGDTVSTPGGYSTVIDAATCREIGDDLP